MVGSPKKKVPFHRKWSNEKSYDVRAVEKWRYEDRKPDVVNSMVPWPSHHPHLVLYDHRGVPRHALEYFFDKDRLIIGTIQRTRTQYRGTPKGWVWDHELETRESKALQRQIGRRPEGEFLFLELLWLHRGQIKKGLPVYLLKPTRTAPEDIEHRIKNYVQMFCEETPETIGMMGKDGKIRHIWAYKMSPRKKMVKQILGLG